MKCPIDNSDLLMTDRNGIEIDYCSQCRGVWLDRGELDKIIEKSTQPAAPTQSSRGQYDQPRQNQYRDDARHHDSGYYKKRKKESFLSDLFDF